MMRPEDVKGELTEYLGKMAINQLFAKVVEQLLLERPPNPIKFIINFLATKFPEQAVGSMADPNRLVEIPQEKKPVEGEEEKVSADGYPPGYTPPLDDSDSEDSGADEIDELVAVNKPMTRHRRVSVCAESVEPDQVRRPARCSGLVPTGPAVCSAAGLRWRQCQPAAAAAAAADSSGGIVPLCSHTLRDVRCWGYESHTAPTARNSSLSAEDLPA